MVSKNNLEVLRQHTREHEHQRFGLRKLTVGVASVLLGTTFYLGMNSIAHADTVNTDNNSTEEVTSNTQVSEQTNQTLNLSNIANKDKQQTTNLNNSNELGINKSVSESDQNLTNNTNTDWSAKVNYPSGQNNVPANSWTNIQVSSPELHDVKQNDQFTVQIGDNTTAGKINYDNTNNLKTDNFNVNNEGNDKYVLSAKNNYDQSSFILNPSIAYTGSVGTTTTINIPVSITLSDGTIKNLIVPLNLTPAAAVSEDEKYPMLKFVSFGKDPQTGKIGYGIYINYKKIPLKNLNLDGIFGSDQTIDKSSINAYHVGDDEMVDQNGQSINATNHDYGHDYDYDASVAFQNAITNNGHELKLSQNGLLTFNGKDYSKTPMYIYFTTTPIGDGNGNYTSNLSITGDGIQKVSQTVKPAQSGNSASSDGKDQQSASVKITYVDQDTHQPVGTDYIVSGKSGEQKMVDITGHVPTNYEIFSGTNIPSMVTIGSQNSTIKVPVRLRVSDDIETPDALKNKYIQKIVYQDNGIEVGTAMIPNLYRGSNLSAGILKNKINNNIPGGYDLAIDYHYPSTITNIQKTPAIIFVPVILTNNQQNLQMYNQKINYINVDGHKLVADFDIKLPEGTGIDSGALKDRIIQNKPANYKIVDNYKYPDSISWANLNLKPIDVLVQDDTKTINPNDKDATGDMWRSITRKIIVENPDGTKHETNQVVSYERDKTIDKVTGKTVSYGQWQLKAGSKNQWDEFITPTIKGYTPSQERVNAYAPRPTDRNQTITITYTKNESTPVPYNPGKNDVNDDMNHYTIRIINVHNPLTDQVEPTKQVVKLSREDKNGNAGYIDPVTNAITWNAWHITGDFNKSAGTWDAFNAPKFDGYTSKVDGRDSESVNKRDGITAETSDETVEITYTPVVQKASATITYIDTDHDSDTTIATLTTDGHVGEIMNFTKSPADQLKALEDKGYELVSSDVPTNPKFNEDSTKNDFTVKLKHKTRKEHWFVSYIYGYRAVYEDGTPVLIPSNDNPTKTMQWQDKTEY